MKLPRKPSPTELPLPFEIDDEPIEETLTAWGGVPLLTQAFRSLKVPASLRQHVHIKQRDRGMDEAAMIESFVVLNAVGGECVDDFAHLRADAGLSAYSSENHRLHCAKKKRELHALRKMRGGPSESLCREGFQTATSCCSPMAVVVNVVVKGAA